TTNAGGAVFSDENLTLVQTLIDGNQADRVGAIVANGNLTIKKSVISGNTASIGVGGVYFYGIASPTTNFTLTVKSSTISGNTSVSSTGGGLFLYGGGATISKSVISGNTAFKYGGGIYAASGVDELTITECEVRANRAKQESGPGYGGGIYTQ